MRFRLGTKPSDTTARHRRAQSTAALAEALRVPHLARDLGLTQSAAPRTWRDLRW